MSSTRFRFGRATRADEPEIRALVGSVVMPGTVSVRFGRDPDYFLGTTIQGRPCDVLIARQQKDGALAGVMVRAERQVYLDGRPARVAYIGQIRIAPRFQGRWLMQRAALELAELRDRSIPYFGVIARDNPVALGAITGTRPPGGATIERIARARSLAFVLHRRFVRRPRSLDVRQGDADHLAEIIAFLNRHGPARQLFPVVKPAEFLDGETYRGLRLEDLSIVWRDGEVAGVLGAWDQAAYKQEILDADTPRLRRLRPVYDLMARAIGGRRLPVPGEPIRTAFGCLRCTVDDDPDVFATLLRAARDRALEQGQAFLLVGFDEREPLLRTLGRRLALTYESDVFLGSLTGAVSTSTLDGRAVHIEVATL